MAVYEQNKTAFQDLIAPEIRGIHGEIGTLKVDIRRLDGRIDSLERELKTAIDIRERLVALEVKIRP